MSDAYPPKRPPLPPKKPPQGVDPQDAKETDPKKLAQAVDELCGTLKKRNEAKAAQAFQLLPLFWGFSREHVDLVISDHFLRDKRGTAQAEEMKRLKPDAPVMILSGASEVPEGIEKADIFVTKLETIPVMLEET